MISGHHRFSAMANNRSCYGSIIDDEVQSSIGFSGVFVRRFNSGASSSDQMSLIKQLRERTSAPIKDVKSALVDCNWDIGKVHIFPLFNGN